MSRKPSARPRELFLSHSGADTKFVKRLARALAAHGVTCFVSEQHIQAAQDWHDRIGDALQRCDWFLAVLSPEAVRSEWVKR